MNKEIELLNHFVEAGKKIEAAVHNKFLGFGHAIWCNYQRDTGNGEGRCNCGVADILFALNKFESAPKTIKAKVESVNKKIIKQRTEQWKSFNKEMKERSEKYSASLKEQKGV